MTAGLWDRTLDILFPTPRWATPGALAQALDPRIRQTPALDLIDDALVRWHNTPGARLIVTMAPQEGKSDRCSRWLPAWMLDQDPELKIVEASYAHDLARRNGRSVRDLFLQHEPAFNSTVRADLGAQGEWELEGHRGGVFAVGVGGGLTGRPADRLIVDDPHKDRAEAESEVQRKNVWSWWLDVAVARMSPTASALVIMTRWHEDDLVGRLLAQDDSRWEVLNIPAQCEDADTDPLHREAGEYMVSARGRTREQWEERKREVGSRSWAALYQGHPTPAGGMLFSDMGIRYYERPPWQLTAAGEHVITQGGRVIQSWDLAFKDTKKSDFVVGQVWWKLGAAYTLLDQVRGRLSFTNTCEAIVAMSAKWPQATAKYVEDKANGPAVIDALGKRVPGLIPVAPQGGKVVRAQAVTPLWEAGNVILPAASISPWVGKFVAEALSFPKGNNDDQVDGMTQALYQLAVKPRGSSAFERLW